MTDDMNEQEKADVIAYAIAELMAAAVAFASAASPPESDDQDGDYSDCAFG
jgi:hypothetical protein